MEVLLNKQGLAERQPSPPHLMLENAYLFVKKLCPARSNGELSSGLVVSFLPPAQRDHDGPGHHNAHKRPQPNAKTLVAPQQRQGERERE